MVVKKEISNQMFYVAVWTIKNEKENKGIVINF